MVVSTTASPSASADQTFWGIAILGGYAGLYSVLQLFGLVSNVPHPARLAKEAEHSLKDAH